MPLANYQYLHDFIAGATKLLRTIAELSSDHAAVIAELSIVRPPTHLKKKPIDHYLDKNEPAVTLSPR